MKRSLPSIVDTTADVSQGRHDTLFWIGDRGSLLFHDAYRFCEAHASAIAYRRDIQSALSRAATNVGLLIHCVENDSPKHRSAFDELRRKFSSSAHLLLLGPLCAGQRPSLSELFDCESCYWHEWKSRLPAKLVRCGLRPTEQQPARSVAVVAQTHSNAEALLSIASGGAASATWHRPDEIHRIRNVDQVWWDDSSIPADRVDSLAEQLSKQPQATHVWIANQVTPQAARVATESGVSHILSKPGDYSTLLSLAGSRPARLAFEAA